MPQETFRLSPRGMLLASIAAAFPLASQAAPVARVDFAVGNVMAVAPTGQTRPLAKGAQVEEGETVNTNAGRAQLRFVDGAYVSLQPESEFRIDQYRYEGREDGSENALLSLFKGGLRTITGFIGRSNRKNYQVTTTVATIGIRGTEYTVQYGESIRGTVGDGEIEVCNGAGCLNVTDGETYYVANQDTQPVLTNKGTDLPPAPPESPPQKFADGDNTNEDGDPCVLFPSTCVQPSGRLTGTAIYNVAYVTEFASLNNVPGTEATLDQSSQLVSWTDGRATTVEFFGPYSDVGGDSIIVWGRAADYSGGESVHYVVGLPASEINQLSGVTGTYSLLGGTPITENDTPVGTLDSATMTVNFFGQSLSGNVDMDLTLKAQAWNASGFFSASGSTFSFLAADDGTVGVSSSLDINGTGFFAGANAERAGIVYNLDAFDERLGGEFTNGVGAAALTRDSLDILPQ